MIKHKCKKPQQSQVMTSKYKNFFPDERRQQNSLSHQSGKSKQQQIQLSNEDASSVNLFNQKKVSTLEIDQNRHSPLDGRSEVPTSATRLKQEPPSHKQGNILEKLKNLAQKQFNNAADESKAQSSSNDYCQKDRHKPSFTDNNSSSSLVRYKNSTSTNQRKSQNQLLLNPSQVALSRAPLMSARNQTPTNRADAVAMTFKSTPILY